MGLIFDLDLTLVDTSIAEKYRKSRNWQMTYDLINKFSVYEGIYQILEYIRKEKIDIAIVSSSPAVYCQKVIDYWEFDITQKVCYHDTKLHKPHPEPIEMAVRRYFPTSPNILSFGDRAIDIEASKKANIISVGCLWGSEEKGLLCASNPHYLINKPLEAITLIKQYFPTPSNI